MAVRVIQIAEHQRLGGAGFHAGWLLARRQVGLAAKVALVRHPGDRVDKAHLIGAGGQTIHAADAEIRVDIDDAILLADMGGAGGADMHAGGVVAVLAGLAKEAVLGIREGADGAGADDLEARDPLWHLIHLPAGIHAGGTADAGHLVVDHAVADPVDGLAVGEGGGKGAGVGTSSPRHHDEGPRTHPRHEVTARAAHDASLPEVVFALAALLASCCLL